MQSDRSEKNRLAKRGEAKRAKGTKGERTLRLRSSLVLRPPGSEPFCRKTGPNLTPFRGSGRFFQLSVAVRAIGRDITPGQKLPHCRRPALQPTKPPRTSRARSRRPATSPKRQNGGRERRGLARDSVCVPGLPVDFLALYVLRNMPTVLNVRTHRIPRLVGGKQCVYLRQSQPGGVA